MCIDSLSRYYFLFSVRQNRAKVITAPYHVETDTDVEDFYSDCDPDFCPSELFRKRKKRKNTCT